MKHEIDPFVSTLNSALIVACVLIARGWVSFLIGRVWVRDRDGEAKKMGATVPAS
jgi:hypothetical protein